MASVHMMTAPLEKKEIAAFVKKYAKTKVPRHDRKGLPSKPRPFKGYARTPLHNCSKAKHNAPMNSTATHSMSNAK